MPYLINGRTAVHKDSKGTLLTLDICLTPTGNSVTPIPYTNVAESKDADNTVDSVTVDGNPACNLDSTFSKSRGDEPGSHGGLVSGTKGGEASFIMGSSNVFFTQRPAVRAMDLMVSNSRNTPPANLTQQVSIPPIPGQTADPEALEESQGPHHNAVACATPDGFVSHNQLAALRVEDNLLVTVAPLNRETGRAHLEALKAESSRLAWFVTEATPWPHKTGQYLTLPLGEHDNVLREEPIDEPGTELVYLQPQRYLTADKDPDQVDSLRDGWLYVFVNGHLWRELEVTQGRFKDVDLQTWQGVDGGAEPDTPVTAEDEPSPRQGTGLNQRTIEVPSRMAGEPCEVHIAYSEVQWSWARIVSLGGLHPEDPRRTHIVSEGETLSGIALAYPAVKNARVLADLNGLNVNATLSIGQALAIRPDDEIPDDAADQRSHRMGEPVDLDAVKADGFQLTLDDPLGLAEGKAAEHREYRERISTLVDALKNGRLDDEAVNPTVNGQPIDPQACRIDKFKLAQATNYLFNRATLDLEQPGADLDSESRDALGNLKECADAHLDRSYLRDYLHLDDLEQLARHLLAAKIEFVDIVQHQGAVSFTEATRDYGYLPPKDKYRLIKRVQALTLGLKEHPALEFAAWLPDNQLLDELAEIDPGGDLILQLVGSHPEGKRHPLADFLTPEDTGPGIDDYACRGFPYFDIDGLRQNDALTHQPGSQPDVTFSNSKNAVSFLYTLYRQWMELPEPELSDTQATTVTVSESEKARQQARIAQLEQEKQALERSLADQARQVHSLKSMERNAEQTYLELLAKDSAHQQGDTRGARLTYQTLKQQRGQAEQRHRDLKTEHGRVRTDLTLAREPVRRQTTDATGQTTQQRPARLSAQVDPLRPLVKGIQSITRVFTEVELSVEAYWQGIYPGQALPLDLPMRQNAAQSEYRYLSDLLKGEGPLVTTYLSGGLATALPVGSGMKRTPLSQFVQDLTREAAVKADLDPTAANDPSPKVTVLALKRDASVRTPLPTETIEFTPLPDSQADLQTYLDERVGELRKTHKVPGDTLKGLTGSAEQPLRQRAAAELLLNKVDGQQQVANINVETIEKNTQAGDSLVVASSGKRKTIYRGYKALFSAFAVMEIWNIQRVVAQAREGGYLDIVTLTNSGTAIAALIAHLHQTQVEFLYGKISKKEFNAVRRRNSTVSSSTLSPEKLRVARRKFFSTAAAQGFGALANFVGMGVAGLEAHKSWQRNDPWAVTGQGLIAVGSAVSSLADTVSFYKFVVEGVVSARYTRALGWWGLGLTGLGFALFWFLKDTPMEAWLKHSPFGKARADIDSDEYRYWNDWPALAREQLAALQQTPDIAWYPFNGVPVTNHDFWNQEVTLTIRRPAWQEGVSSQNPTLWWRPADQSEADWRPLGYQPARSVLDPAGIDWQHTKLEPSPDGTVDRLTLTWQALYRLLKEAQSIELKAEYSYCPQGQSKPFSPALNQPLVLPTPERTTPPFNAPVHEPTMEATVVVRSTRPVNQVPLPDKDKRPVHLITGQTT